ncbi:MAG: putative lipid II flippase FtsW [Rhodospirillaceae bacterium]|nr:MAG: putative lipid II flippase FtsW [Rhodospirillaceae bacterium]
MTSFARADTSVLSRWWWTVDRWTLAAIALLIGIGVLVALAASPSVAERIGVEPLYFVRRHLIFLPLALGTVFFVSLMTPKDARRLAIFVFLVSMILLVLVLFIGTEVKGARRWITIAGFSLQPSEFIKPSFAVLAAWMFAEHQMNHEFSGRKISIALCGIVLLLLLAQPDIGMAIVVLVTWCTQLFLSGLPLLLAGLLFLLAISGLIGAYFVFPHVALRIDSFFDPSSTSGYQVSRAMEAFGNGGLFGRGPGEGHIKETIPDAHADFVFAVIGEEFGLFACLLIVSLFAFIFLRGLSRMLQEESLFLLLAVTGLLTQFSLQAFINLASTLNLIPTKGMTLPFISYGGSSLVALAFTMGLVLSFTRRHSHSREKL